MNEYYISSSGEKKKISEMNTEYILNAMGKKMREIFNSTTYEEYTQMLNEINALKEEYYKRLNQFVEKIGEKNGE